VKIDVHCHIYPRAYLDEIAALRQVSPEVARWTEMVPRALQDDRFWSVERRLADVEEMGVDLQVLSVGIPAAYLPERESAVALCQMSNDLLIELARQHPNRFRVFAAVPLHFPEEALREVARVADTPEIVGVMIGSNSLGTPVNHPDALPFYAELERHELPFFMHPMCCTPGREAMEEFNLAPMVGYLMDSSLAALKLIFTGVFEEHPRLTFIMPHLGALLPYIMGRIEHQYYERPQLYTRAPQPPMEYFKRFYYDTVSESVPALRLACELFGPDHIVYGTDFPFWDTAVRIARDVEALELPPAQQEAIFSGNARRILPRLGLA
jgi:aminocarboxymuconate-semialdehyde decarboxylase